MYKAVVIGASAGGIDALMLLLSKLKKPFKCPIIIVVHLKANFRSELARIIENRTRHKCIEIEDKMNIESGVVYISPPNYHSMVEKEFHFSLSVTEKVCYARPSIDVLFESAADAFRDTLVGIVLTGANNDGSNGLKEIKEVSGLTIVQDPEEASVSEMPSSAINITKPDYILTLTEIAKLLNSII